jgi:hypothetical protein
LIKGEVPALPWPEYYAMKYGKCPECHVQLENFIDENFAVWAYCPIGQVLYAHTTMNKHYVSKIKRGRE